MNPEPRHPRQPPNPRFRVSTLRPRSRRRQPCPPPPQSPRHPPKTHAQPVLPGARSKPWDAMQCTVSQPLAPPARGRRPRRHPHPPRRPVPPASKPKSPDAMPCNVRTSLPWRPLPPGDQHTADAPSGPAIVALPLAVWHRLTPSQCEHIAWLAGRQTEPAGRIALQREHPTPPPLARLARAETWTQHRAAQLVQRCGHPLRAPGWRLSQATPARQSGEPRSRFHPESRQAARPLAFLRVARAPRCDRAAALTLPRHATKQSQRPRFPRGCRGMIRSVA